MCHGIGGFLIETVEQTYKNTDKINNWRCRCLGTTVVLASPVNRSRTAKISKKMFFCDTCSRRARLFHPVINNVPDTLDATSENVPYAGEER